MAKGAIARNKRIRFFFQASEEAIKEQNEIGRSSGSRPWQQNGEIWTHPESKRVRGKWKEFGTDSSCFRLLSRLTNLQNVEIDDCYTI